MFGFARRSLPARLSAIASFFAGAAILAACTMPANNGFNQSRQDAMPFSQANERCWMQAYGGPSGGGSSQFASAMTVYDRCMAQAGWERGKTMF